MTVALINKQCLLSFLFRSKARRTNNIKCQIVKNVHANMIVNRLIIEIALQRNETHKFVSFLHFRCDYEWC